MPLGAALAAAAAEEERQSWACLQRGAAAVVVEEGGCHTCRGQGAAADYEDVGASLGATIERRKGQ